MSNLQRLRTAMSDCGIAALVVSDLANVQWLTGFSGSSGNVLVTESNAVFLTDGRYTIQAENEVQGMPVAIYQRPMSLDGFVAQHAKELGVSTLHFEQSVTYGGWQALKGAMNGTGIEPAPDIVRSLRMVKTSDEVEKIMYACGITDACLTHVSRMIQAGVSELDIQIEIEFFIKRQGAEVAFHPIAVSGANSARPHGRATEKKIERGDFVTLDLGAKKDGYCSDITRTFVVGEASERHRKVYDAVLAAECAAIDAAVLGASGVSVDAVARGVLEKEGLAQYFVHGLGHGLGRDVHDPGNLSQSSKDTLAAGNVYTIEPGVYIEGFGGVRIEDDVHVTPTGPEVLTHFPKELTILG